MGPKQCECGTQAKSVDSRQRGDYVYRRYECPTCHSRWSTCEVRLDFETTSSQVEALMAKKYASCDREVVADKLIALAQELLRGGTG